ncbi:MAG TPA: hypothetical protein VGH64_17515 [Puia sp.]|jgi:hypothetical protein
MEKHYIIKFFAGAVLLIMGAVGCSKSNNHNPPPTPTVYYDQADQAGRPAINTVFIPASGKDSFNTTPPTQMPALFTNDMKTSLSTLNPGYTTNLLGLSADQFIGVLSTDVLNASTTGVTSFYNGTQVLTGRTLGDDVIDVELILLFGGPDGSMNPGLTSDHVNGNDKTFLTSFPYEASPW